jgi:hypothetical protein
MQSWEYLLVALWFNDMILFWPSVVIGLCALEKSASSITSKIMCRWDHTVESASIIEVVDGHSYIQGKYASVVWIDYLQYVNLCWQTLPATLILTLLCLGCCLVICPSCRGIFNHLDWKIPSHGGCLC